MKLRKILCLLTALCLIVGVMAGCGSSSDSAETAESEEQSAEAEPAEEPEESEEPEEVPAEEPEEPAEEPEPEPAEEPEAASAAEEPAEEPEETPAEEGGAAHNDTVISYPLSDGSATLSLWCTKPGGPPVVRDSWSEVEIFQDAEESLGVKIEWTEVDMMVVDTQLNLMIAAGDYPDIISGIVGNYPTGTVGAYDDGVIVDIANLTYDNMPNYWNYVHADPEVEKYVMTEEGYELAVYVVNDQQLTERGLLVRQDWLDALGMDVPQTFDEFTDMLVAFKDAYNCKNTLCVSESGLTVTALTDAFDIVYFDDDLSLYVDDSGKLVCSYMTDNYKEFLQMVNNWYNLELFDADYLLNDTGVSMNDTQTIICSEDTGAFYTSGNQLDTYYTYSENPEFDVTPINILVKNAGDDTTNRFVVYEPVQSGQTVSISTGCENVELALQWLDYWYSDEGTMAMTYGTEGVTYEVAPDGTVTYTDMIVNNDQDMSATGYIMKYNCQGKICGVMLQKANWAYYTEKQQEVIDFWSSQIAFDRTIPDYVSMSTEETLEYNNIITDIVTYAETELNKFLFGTRDFSEWDDFTAQLEAMGIQDAIDIYQAAYDRQVG